MKKLTLILLSTILGIAICFAAIFITNSLRVTPKFPAFAGEDDFEMRIRYFFLIVCPGFAVIGAWIGYVFTLNKRVGSWMWGGVVVGSFVTFSFAYLLSPVISNISTSDTANYGVLALFLSWVIFSALGAWVVRVAFHSN
jgi:hypothetical protein